MQELTVMTKLLPLKPLVSVQMPPLVQHVMSALLRMLAVDQAPWSK